FAVFNNFSLRVTDDRGYTSLLAVNPQMFSFCPNCFTAALFQLPNARKSEKLGAVSPPTPDELMFQYHNITSVPRFPAWFVICCQS
ncbi:hypothetical protein PENTCL1PPCAC_6556, partial [Pristionchus entomophagus]